MQLIEHDKLALWHTANYSGTFWGWELKNSSIICFLYPNVIYSQPHFWVRHSSRYCICHCRAQLWRIKSWKLVRYMWVGYWSVTVQCCYLLLITWLCCPLFKKVHQMLILFISNISGGLHRLNEYAHTFFFSRILFIYFLMSISSIEAERQQQFLKGNGCGGLYSFLDFRPT